MLFYSGNDNRAGGDRTEYEEDVEDDMFAFSVKYVVESVMRRTSTYTHTSKTTIPNA